MKTCLEGTSFYGKAAKLLQSFLLVGRSQMTEKFECPEYY